MESYKEMAEYVKEQLASGEPEGRYYTISGLLEFLRQNDSEAFVMELVYKGVISDLLRNTYPDNRRNILECINIIVEKNAFYTNDLIGEVIQGIKTRRLTESVEENASVVKIFEKIIAKVFEFREIDGINLIQKHQDVFLDLITHAYFDSVSCLSLNAVLNFIIGYTTNDFKLTQISRIKSSYSLNMELLVKSQDISDLKKIEKICYTTILLAKLCNEINDDELNAKISAASSGASSIHQIPLVKQEIYESIRKSTMNYVIPLAKELEMDVETASNLVELLNTVLKLREVKDAHLCVELLDNGYLKCLLELSLLYLEKYSFRIIVCRLISEIIGTLTTFLQLPIDDSPKGLVSFQDFLSNGIASLPTDIKEWDELLKINNKISNSLLILLFCHYLGTFEMYIFSQKSLAIRLLSVDIKCEEPIILRALWLLYSVSALNTKISSTPSDLRLYTKAIQKLQTILTKKDKIESVYTHVEEVLLFSMKEFPKKLSIKVISLWLDNSECEENFDTFIKECLVQGDNELKIVKLLMHLVHGNHIADPNNAVNACGALLRFRQVLTGDVVDFIWETLSEDLADYMSKNSKITVDILKTVLRFISALPTSKSCCIGFLRKCAINIGKISIKENADWILKTLLINAAAFLIRQSAVSNYSKVGEIFLKNDAFLKEVYECGMSFSEIALTNICIRVFTCLIVHQINYNIKSMTVAELTFKDLDSLLLKLREHECFAMFGVELINFLLKSEIENPVIKLRRLENDSDVQNIYNVYFLIHLVHAETPPGEEDQAYKCLSTILLYGCAQNLNMGIFLMCPATPLLIELAVTGFSISNKLSYDFLNFAATWLCSLKNYRDKTQFEYKSIPEDSVELLIKVPDTLELDDDDDGTVDNFLKAVSYFKNSKE